MIFCIFKNKKIKDRICKRQFQISLTTLEKKSLAYYSGSAGFPAFIKWRMRETSTRRDDFAQVAVHFFRVRGVARAIFPDGLGKWKSCPRQTMFSKFLSNLISKPDRVVASI